MSYRTSLALHHQQCEIETGRKVHMADEQIQELSRVCNDQICEGIRAAEIQKDEQRRSASDINAGLLPGGWGRAGSLNSCA